LKYFAASGMNMTDEFRSAAYNNQHLYRDSESPPYMGPMWLLLATFQSSGTIKMSA